MGNSFIRRWLKKNDGETAVINQSQAVLTFNALFVILILTDETWGKIGFLPRKGGASNFDGKKTDYRQFYA